MPSLPSKQHSEVAWFWSALIILAALFFAPYVWNFKYIMAVNGENNLYAFDLLTRNFDRFRADSVSYFIKAHIAGSLANYFPLWLVQQLKFPVLWVYHTLLLFQFFALPLIIIRLLKRHLSALEQLCAFLFILMCGYLFWNVDLHGQVDIPYAAELCIPFIFLGLYWISEQKKIGYLSLTVAALIHPAFALYALAALFFFYLLRQEPFHFIEVILFLIPLAAALIPPLFLLSADIPTVSNRDLWRAWELNMHGMPWASGFRWFQAFPNLIALLFLAAVTYPSWKCLGKRYKLLLISAGLSFFFFGCLHILGHALKILPFVQILGLRAQTLFVIFFLPVLILFFKDKAGHSEFGVRFWTVFIIVYAVLAQPYGLDKAPALLLGAFLWIHSRKMGRPVKWLFYGLSIVWILIWLFYQPPKPNPFAPSTIGNAWHLGDYLRTNSLIDFVGRFSMEKKIVILGISGIFAWAPNLLNKYQDRSWAGNITAFALLFLFLMPAYGHYLDKANQRLADPINRDIHDAQLWAKENTKPSARFLSRLTNWRTISERSLFTLQPEQRYIYYPHHALREMDEMAMAVLGHRKDFYTMNQKQWYFVQPIAYFNKFLRPLEFLRLNRVYDADYLVETRKLNLPIVYKNDSYFIYNLRRDY